MSAFKSNSLEITFAKSHSFRLISFKLLWNSSLQRIPFKFSSRRCLRSTKP